MEKRIDSLIEWIANPTHKIDPIVDSIDRAQKLKFANSDKLLLDLKEAYEILIGFKYHLFSLLNPTFLTWFYGNNLIDTNSDMEVVNFKVYCEKYMTLTEIERYKKFSEYPPIQQALQDIKSFEELIDNINTDFVGKKRMSRFKYFFLFFIWGLITAIVIDGAIKLSTLDKLLSKYLNEYTISIIQTGLSFAIGKYFTDKFQEREENNVKKRRLLKEVESMKEFSIQFNEGYDNFWKKFNTDRKKASEAYLRFTQMIYKKDRY